MRIFKNRWFAKFAKKERISDKKLLQAITDAESGLVDADYGGGVIKQRIARTGEGKSGGHRSIILYLKGKKAFFVYGFSKNDRDNITKEEAAQFKKLAKHIFVLRDKDLAKLVDHGAFEEVANNGENENL